MKRRITAVILSLAIILSIITQNTPLSTVNAAEARGVNVAMLEGLLNERSWVLDTLVRNDYSNNPYVKYGSKPSASSLMSDVLARYKDTSHPDYNPAYKAMVDIMEKVYNGEDRVQSLASYVEDFFDLFGGEDNANDFANDIMASFDEIQYEKLMYDILSADYVSSSGERLGNFESQLINVRRLQDSLDKANKWLTFINNFAENDNGQTVDDVTMSEYTNDFLLPYIDSIEDFLFSFDSVQSSPDGEALKNMLTAYALIDIYERFESKETSIGGVFMEYSPNYLLSPNTLALIDGVGKSVSIHSTAMDSYAYIEAMNLQGDSVGAAIRRVAAETNDNDMKDVLNYVAELIEAEAEENTENYESIVSAVRRTNVIADLATPVMSVAVKSLTDKALGVGSAKMLSATLSKATALVNLVGFGADTAIGLKETCEKTYELLYLEDLIYEARQTFNNDYIAYQNNPTDENAKKVLDDLLLLQRMRLRGETIAHKMVVNQFDSALGRLLGGGSLLSERELLYQTMVDGLIGASVVNMPTKEVIIHSGQVATVADGDNGDMYAEVFDGGSSYILGELTYNTLNGITVQNGGTLRLGDSLYPAATGRRYLPAITNSGGTVEYYDSSIKMSEFSQTSGSTIFNGDMTFIGEDFRISGGTLTSTPNKDKPTIRVRNFTGSGTPTLGEIPFYIVGDTKLSGTMHMSNIFLNGNIAQNIGGGSVEKLSFLNGSAAGVTVTSDIVVTESVFNNSTKLINGTDILLRGDISGSTFNGGLTLDGNTLTSYKQINGDSVVQKNVTVSSIKFMSLLTQNANSILDVNGSLTVLGDSAFNGTAVNVSGTYTSGGNITGRDNVLHAQNVTLNSDEGQSITSEFTTPNLSIDNDSISGVSFNSEVTVTDSLQNTSSRVREGNNLLLQGDISGGYLHSGLTLDGAALTGTKRINGLTNIRGNTTAENVTFASNAVQVADSNLTVTGNLTLEQDAIFNGSSVQVGGILTSGGDMYGEDDIINAAALTFNAKSEQSINCSITAGEINNTNESTLGVEVNKPITVTGNLRSTASTLNAGENLHITATTKFPDNVFHGDITAVEDTADLPTTLHGTLNVKSDGSIDEVMHIDGALKIDGATLTVNENITVDGLFNLANSTDVLTIPQDTVFSANQDSVNNGSINGEGKITLYGDLINNNSINVGAMEVNVYHNVGIYGGDFTVGSLVLNGYKRFTSEQEITVTDNYTTNNVFVTYPERILFNSSGDGESKVYNGTVNATGDWTVAAGTEVTINGSLSVGGNLTVEEGATLTVKGGLINSASSSNSVTIAQGATVTVHGYSIFNTGSTDISSDIIFYGDVISNTATVSGSGNIELYGDLYCSSGSINGGQTLEIKGKAPQTISGSITVGDIILNNPSSGGVIISGSVGYTGTLSNQNETKVTGSITEK